jgi:hypothetical protein
MKRYRMVVKVKDPKNEKVVYTVRTQWSDNPDEISMDGEDVQDLFEYKITGFILENEIETGDS